MQVDQFPRLTLQSIATHHGTSRGVYGLADAFPVDILRYYFIVSNFERRSDSCWQMPNELHDQIVEVRLRCPPVMC